MFKSSLGATLIKPHGSVASRAATAPLLKPFPRILSANPINTGLLARWLFGESSGTAVLDASGNGRHLILNGGTWQSGLTGYNVLLNGTSHQATGTMGAGPNVLSAFTVMVRLSLTNTTQANTYMMSYGSNGMSILFGYVAGTTEFYTQFFTGTDPRTSTGITWPSDTNIHTLVYSYSAGSQKGYLDGALLVNMSKTFTLTNSGTAIAIGSTGTTSFTAGAFDGAALWDRQLTDSEVLLISNNPLFGIEAVQ